jgi:hypothetical protein
MGAGFGHVAAEASIRRFLQCYKTRIQAFLGGECCKFPVLEALSRCAAGLAVGFFKDTDELVANWSIDRRSEPAMSQESRQRLFHFWKKAVARSFDWVE